MSPYRVAEAIPPKEYDVERPYFPRVGEVVRICRSKFAPHHDYDAGRIGYVGVVQMITENGVYFVGFPAIAARRQFEGAAFFRIVELEVFDPLASALVIARAKKSVTPR